MTDDKEILIEKLSSILTESEIQLLTESVDTDYIFSMYGQKAPKEKNINRVIAGLQGYQNSNPNMGVTNPHAVFGPPPPDNRTIQILELQIKKLLSDQKELHNRYVSLIRNQNQLVDRVNKLSALLKR